MLGSLLGKSDDDGSRVGGVGCVKLGTLLIEGFKLGRFETTAVGFVVTVGKLDGTTVGPTPGNTDGLRLGIALGSEVGMLLPVFVGIAVGVAVG